MENSLKANARTKSLGRTLTIGMVSILFVFLATALGFSFYSARSALYQQFDRTLMTRAELAVRRIEQRNEVLRVHERKIAGLPLLAEFGGQDNELYIVVRDWNHSVVFRSGEGPGSDLDLRVEPPAVFAAQTIDVPDGPRLRAIAYRFLPLLDNQHEASYPRKHATVTLAGDRTRVELAARELAYLLGGVGLGVVLLTGLMVAFVIRRLLAPLETLATRAEGIQAVDLDERFPSSQFPLELVPVSDCLNRLLDRLERSFRRERSFSADVAHELLTPITELRSLAEFGIRYPQEDREEVLRQSLAVLQKMESLVTTLLDLARLEQDRVPAPREPVPLRSLVLEALDLHAASAAARGLAWEALVGEEARLLGQSEPLRLILNNLISNAAAYADQGGQILVEWEESKEHGSLRVLNPASKLSRGQVDRLFDRFWRGDSSRSDSGHFGLGLCLSRELARSMGLELSASLSEQGVLCMTLRQG